MKIFWLFCLSILLVGCGVTSHPEATWSDQSLSDCAQNPGGVNYGLCVSLMAHRYLDGPHPVRKMVSETTNTPYSKSSGGFFLLAGNWQSESGTETSRTVTFAWKMADGAYAISTINLDHVRVQLVDTSEPYVYFKWHTLHNYDEGGLFENTARYYTRAIREVTVVCRPEDWPVSITLPLNK